MTTVITGRDLTLTIDGTSYDPQVLAATLAIEENRQTYETLAGRVEKRVDEVGTLSVSMLSDWGVVGGLCSALWQAAADDPDVALAFTLGASGDEWAGFVYPTKPPVTGSGNEGSKIDIELRVKGEPVPTWAV